MNNSLKTDKTTSQDLSAGALTYTTSFGRAFKLEQIIFRFSVAVTETITVTLDSKHGSDYDTVLRTTSLSGNQNYTFIPEGQNNFQAGDEIKIECTNANLTGTVYAQIKTKEILK